MNIGRHRDGNILTRESYRKTRIIVQKLVSHHIPEINILTVMVLPHSLMIVGGTFQESTNLELVTEKRESQQQILVHVTDIVTGRSFLAVMIPQIQVLRLRIAAAIVQLRKKIDI